MNFRKVGVVSFDTRGPVELDSLEYVYSAPNCVPTGPGEHPVPPPPPAC